MKKYLLIALAALGFAACADPQDDINNPALGGEVEESFIAINLMSADVETRAAEDSYGYEEGTDAERAINTAYFFFFDENGNPFNVTASAPGGDKNHLALTLNGTTDGTKENVSDITNAVLVLNTYKGVYPSKIVAVLNWTPAENTTYTLSKLHELLADLGNDTDGYVMSNSVYMDGAGNVVDATPLTAANIKTSAEKALDAPVDIYVERIAAKVVLTAGGKVEDTDNIFDTQKPSTPVVVLGSASEIDVYVQIHGWELYNDYTTSNLLKTIDPAWSVTDLGLTWNDIPYYRSYWADSQDTAISDSFAWGYDYDDDDKIDSYGLSVGEATYCGENTRQAEADTDGTILSDPRTKVILKGQLMQKNGENYESLELARWYGTEYVGRGDLKTAVANSLKYTLYYKYTAGGVEKYVSIAPEDLECVAGTPGAEAYEVGFQLSTTGEGKTWYKYDSVNGYVSMGAKDAENDENKAKTNEYLATVEPALLYANGQTYYFVDIQHLGTAEAKYGVVRNHVYQIDIESIKGYGSPVYNGFSNIVTPPEYPTEDEASYVAARINVLSWKVVKQGVNVGN